jgi:3-phenylpropionate/trans-cinnamate dioxygenase ferredoxin reductase subunit
MTDQRVLIVGTGQAGFQAAASLRQEGYGGDILMVGEEAALPYQRPPLSKAYLREGKVERLTFRVAEFYQQNAIDLRTGLRVHAIDRRCRTALLGDGETVAFSHLILATGASNRKLPLAGITGRNVMQLRTLSHADTVRKQMARSERIAVIGGGFIGLEFGAMANSLRKRVVVIEAQPRLMARAVSPPMSEFFLRGHRASGIEVRLGHAVTRLEIASDGNVEGVVLSNGELIVCDMMLVAVGVVPNTELAEQSGLETENGIVVDPFLMTSDPNISAVGDCVCFPMYGGRLRLESVQNAVDQARCVARRIVGRMEPYAKMPWFWSDQGPYKLQIAGLVRPMAKTVVRANSEATKIVTFSFESGFLTAVETVNQPGDHMAARKALESPRVTHDQLREADYDLKRLACPQQGADRISSDDLGASALAKRCCP